MAKKQKTKTGALPNSAGFPGKDMIHFEICGEACIFPSKTTDKYEPYKLIGVEKNNDHKFWE